MERGNRGKTSFSTCLMQSEIRRSTNGNFALGCIRFKRKIKEALGRSATPGTSRRPKSEVHAGKRQVELL